MASIVALASGLAFTLGLVALLAWGVRRWAPGLTPGRGPGSIEVLSRTSLAPRQGVATIRVEGRLMVVSFGEGGVRHLADVAPGETGEGARPGPEADERHPTPFAGVLERAGRRVRRVGGLRALMLLGGLVAACTAPLAAQQAPDLDPEVVQEAIESLRGGGTGPTVTLSMGDEDDDLRVTGTVGTVIFIGFLTILPTLLLLTTSFTRILIVLHLLKQALGTQTAPPAHMIAAMALLLTGFVMAPTFAEVNRTALAPWMDGEIDELQMLQAASSPMRDFMLGVARDQDVATFLDMRDAPPPETIDDVPFVVVMSAFVTTELTNAFQMGFALFLPFVVIDLVVASVLMSMGMFMLPPIMVSLPFKLLLFVMVDGWSLVITSLVQSF